MNADEQRLLAALIQQQRWAALATQGSTGPEASWVACVPEADFGGFLLHLSTLAAHTRNLRTDSRAGLAISQPEQDGTDPQTLARVMMQGHVTPISSRDPDYPTAAARYQAQLPASTPRFAFTDFILLRFLPHRIRWVSGFARAYTLDAAALQRAVADFSDSAHSA